MSLEITLVTLFTIGLLGGVHCVGMCGGIVGALTFGLDAERHNSAGRMMPLLLAYNAGRITSYVIAGALFGAIGMVASQLGELRQVQLLLQLVAALFMLGIGLYLGGWWYGVTRIEKLGGVLWHRIEPIGRRFLPVRTPRQALLLGMLWGWLPCGLVYNALIFAMTSGDIISGALLMLAFGLGTLPNLLAMGLVATRLTQWARHLWVRRAAGVMVLVFGFYMLALALRGWYPS
ncbi:hypothetical protein BOW53_01880 [Solemya pervernicosa gill symbiont]|uniref:Urease accessory protein UreH-like transmembrane domain-containing protein n=2 Tax=Gammaproteobacteria incertae sedis TaxID=118884 RepID=A0A1T2LA17_9GAMM|nr:sulfite exporter TauE/SafE family protein [Candidatus Reidiella endopervernicosa]OOZ41943.1 hypothetical protein BOW53_01880 [Solemya pervernicosa gill symbiont]QKQ24909.1 sulfite exporter TauE/SafE family protein [Candidatus Reidiella endopervernicosa]